MTDDPAEPWATPEPAAKTRKPQSKTEWAGQQAFWVFLQKALPRGAMCRSVDEAAKRSRDANVRRKARGCLGGFGDIYVFWENTTVWLECKAGSSQRDTQESFERLIKANKGHYYQVKTLEDVEAACLLAGIPLRASLGDIRDRIADQRARLPARSKRSSKRGLGADNGMSLAQYHSLHGKGLL